MATQNLINNSFVLMMGWYDGDDRLKNTGIHLQLPILAFDEKAAAKTAEEALCLDVFRVRSAARRLVEQNYQPDDLVGQMRGGADFNAKAFGLWTKLTETFPHVFTSVIPPRGQEGPVFDMYRLAQTKAIQFWVVAVPRG